MPKSRTERRGLSGAMVKLYPAETSLGWRVIRYVTPAMRMEKLANGEWRDVYDEHDNFAGCQVVATFKCEFDLASGATSTSITARECELNAFAHMRKFRDGRSLTAGMSEEQRISRRHPVSGKALPPEDAVERAEAKVDEHSLPHADRAVRVYPKIA